MRIGIFGGTFDPPHNGHLRYAQEFIERLKLDKLIVVPTFVPPHKIHEDTAGSADRMAMTKLLFADCKKAEVNDMEIRRKGCSYTCDTVDELDRIYPDDDLIFLIGSDMLMSFHSWWQPEEILKHVKICAVTRSDEITTQMLEMYVKKYFPDKTDRFIICGFKPIEISSTEIRSAVRNGKSISNFVNSQVEEYIKEKELYL